MKRPSARKDQVRPLGYAKPEHLGWARSTRQVIVDTLVGLCMVSAGCVVAAVGIVLERILPSSWFDRPLDLIPNGLLRIAGKRPPERPKW